jgi:hypothetical protein
MSSDGVTTMWCIWCEYKAATWEKIYVSSSPDGITWAAPTLILTTAASAAISPSVLWDGAQFVMYTNDLAAGYVMNYRTCATMDGVWSAPGVVVFSNPYPAGTSGPKHNDVIKFGAIYYMIYMEVDTGINAGLYLAVSTDGINFVIDPNFRLPAQVGVWDYQPYRASLIRAGDGLDIYYSGLNAASSISKISKTHYILP